VAVRFRTTMDSASPPTAVLAPAATATASDTASGPGEQGGGSHRLRNGARRIAALVVGLGLFVTALGVMKAGAVALIPSLQGSIFTDNIWSTLGMGWLGACMVLSGSPVAASSLTLLDGNAIDASQAFTMLTGSRLGASFVVLVVGFLYALRRTSGQSRRAPMAIGILSLTMTMVAYLPGALIGYFLLTGGHLDGVNLVAPPGLLSVTDTAFGWAVDLAKDFLPSWGLFPVGVGILLLAFRAFDGALPQVDSERLEHRSDAWYKKPWLMFLVGCGVALLTLSVSVALTVLVPLVAKGYLKREDTLPYIAGANITTLADTLVAAILLGNPVASRVVLAQALGVALWTLPLILVFYPPVRGFCLQVSRATLSSRYRLATFIAVLFTVPITLIAI
jgi:solute carrier family 34 (sodium-dependent phosphate cotransporter)